MSDYPEHDKLRLIKNESQKLGEFIEWLESESIWLCEIHTGSNYNDYHPISMSTTELLARYFGIDLARLEDEKRKMLDAQRALNDRR